jgi:hypothetical protein
MSDMPRPAAGLERCPYLGLHDDSSTCLAYPSEWNYCYHAAPAAPVLVSHQADVCLGPRYFDCPVNLSSQWGRLPRPLRGRTSRRGQAQMALLSILLLVLVSLLVDPGLWDRGAGLLASLLQR